MHPTHGTSIDVGCSCSLNAHRSLATACTCSRHIVRTLQHESCRVDCMTDWMLWHMRPICACRTARACALLGQSAALGLCKSWAPPRLATNPYSNTRACVAADAATRASNNCKCALQGGAVGALILHTLRPAVHAVSCNMRRSSRWSLKLRRPLRDKLAFSTRHIWSLPGCSRAFCHCCTSALAQDIHCAVAAALQVEATWRSQNKSRLTHSVRLK